jgi:hypothetical protein
VSWDKELVDASTARMINRPASLDTIVATNLHADILSDLAAALAGSLGIAPTANLDPRRRYPSMFEPIHGSAFDIMGKGLANPVGTFWSVVMLLEHLGELDAARQLMEAIEHVTANPELHTRDLGGTATTAQVTQAVCSRLLAAKKQGWQLKHRTPIQEQVDAVRTCPVDDAGRLLRCSAPAFAQPWRASRTPSRFRFLPRHHGRSWAKP